jgi:hypothetical protein
MELFVLKIKNFIKKGAVKTQRPWNGPTGDYTSPQCVLIA